MRLVQFLEATAYHGSPHKFDKFDSSFMGTGEGAQSYGWGLYFAEHPEVARSYQIQLSGPLAKISSRYHDTPRSRQEMEYTQQLNDVFSSSLGKIPARVPSFRDLIDFYNRSPEMAERDDKYYQANKKEIEGKIKGFETKYKTDPEFRAELTALGVKKPNWDHLRRPFQTAYAAALEQYQRMNVKHGIAGYIYTVEIPNDVIESMIMWDLTLEKQSPNVQKVIGGAIQEFGIQHKHGVTEGWAYYDRIGQALSKDPKSQAMMASKYLDERGIHGTRYLDQESRTAGEGTHNIVLFNPQYATITDRSEMLEESRLDELYTPDVTYLKKYLAGGRELDSDFPRTMSAQFLDWVFQSGYEEIVSQLAAKEYGRPVDLDSMDQNETEEFASDIWWVLPDEMRKGFQDVYGQEYLDYLMRNEPAMVPSTEFFSGSQLLKRQTWLVHFSDDAAAIASKGFKFGMDQMDQLGLTTHFKDEGFDKSRGGYNFAFEAGGRYADDAASEGRYGSDVVMFTNAGIKAYHSGDEEEQVIFWGANVDPRGIILITQNDGWCVNEHPSKGRFQGECVFSHEDLNTVTNWVEQNWRQYAKIITGW